jgi:hypothetical protein
MSYLVAQGICINLAVMSHSVDKNLSILMCSEARALLCGLYLFGGGL